MVDVGSLVAGEDDLRAARAIDDACREVGFFSIVNHGVDAGVRTRLADLSREFFALDEREKAEIAMSRGGRAWRGWFPVGGELTSGVPDLKEGVYFGEELGADDDRVRARLPLHGPNLFPRHPAALREVVLAYMHALTGVAFAVMRGVALGLGLTPDWFARELAYTPTILFRIFRYPPSTTADEPVDWGVREHTDYGLLTILMQDGPRGLEVRTPAGWLAVPAEGDALVCNIGDMLERMTGGRYVSTPHRVRNTGADSRLSFPFFFDPAWDAEVGPIPGLGGSRRDDRGSRWDGASVRDTGGTYGDYLLPKVARVFPALGEDVL